MMAAAAHLRGGEFVPSLGLSVSYAEPRSNYESTHTFVMFTMPPTYGAATPPPPYRALHALRLMQDPATNENALGISDAAWRSWVSVPNGYLFEVTR